MNKKNATLAFYDCDCDWLPRPLERHFGKANRSEREGGREGERLAALAARNKVRAPRLS